MVEQEGIRKGLRASKSLEMRRRNEGGAPVSLRFNKDCTAFKSLAKVLQLWPVAI